MIKNFITEILHATKKVITPYLYGEHARINELDAGKLLDNGEVYGEVENVKQLTVNPENNKSRAGSIPQPARIDHTHYIEPPFKLKINANSGDEALNYNGTEEKSITLTPDLSGAAKKDHKSTTTEYGVADGSNYGHVKLTSSTSSYGVNDGYAVTPYALSSLKNTIEKEYAKKSECYGVESFITPKSGSKFLKWYPSRTGIYRIYLIGGGGFSSPGMAVKATGDPSPYEDGLGLGTVMAGYGGSGGDVTVIDLKIKEVILDSSLDDASEDETSGDGEEVEESEDRVATIKFFSERAISGYNESTGAYSYASSDSGAVSYVRSVGISGLRTLGEILTPQPCSTDEKYSAYDAIAAHGADAVRYKKSDGTYACGLFRSSEYTAPTCGGSANYSGGAGNSLRPTAPAQSSTLNNSSKRRDGYCGGYPGSVNVHGSVGELGSPGTLVSYATYTAKSVKDVIKVRGGTGGCLSLQDLSNYHGSFKDFDATATSFGFPKTTPSNGGGYGYYGGGHGGGGATIVTNSTFTGSTAKYMNIWQRNASNAPCVVIAFLGNG